MSLFATQLSMQKTSQASPSQDDDASPPCVVDVLHRYQDDVCIQRSRRRSQCRISYDELCEILSWMPAKSVIKFSSLCKSLCDLLSEPYFIKKQCIRSFTQDNGFILKSSLPYNLINSISYFELHLLPWQTKSAFEIPHDSFDYLFEYGCILSSSNGLLLLCDEIQISFDSWVFEFWVCNPATREWAPLLTPEGFDFCIDEYMTAFIECSPHHQSLNDYTIALPAVAKTNSDWDAYLHPRLLIYSNGRWEEELCDISVEHRQTVRYDKPVAVFSDAAKGLVVHYLCESGFKNVFAPDFDPDRDYLEPYIAGFSIREKKLLRRIKLPEGAWNREYGGFWEGSWRKFDIFKWKDKGICLVRQLTNLEFAVWVLEDVECCSSESWRLVMNKKVEEMGLSRESITYRNFGIVSGKGLLIATDERLYVYVMEGEEGGRLEDVGEHGFPTLDVMFIPYANTLRPVQVANTDTFSY